MTFENFLKVVHPLARFHIYECDNETSECELVFDSADGFDIPEHILPREITFIGHNGDVFVLEYSS